MTLHYSDTMSDLYDEQQHTDIVQKTINALSSKQKNYTLSFDAKDGTSVHISCDGKKEIVNYLKSIIELIES